MGTTKTPKLLLKIILIPICFFLLISVIWIVLAMVGRVKASSVIPACISMQVSIPNPVRLIDNVLAHESTIVITHDFPAVASLVNTAHESMNGFLRLAARGNIEFALLSGEYDGNLAVVWDMGLLSPVLRLLPLVSRFANVPNLYYVQAGKNSRFEFRTDDMTLFIGSYRNLLFITDNAAVFERRSVTQHENEFVILKPSNFDVSLLISNEYISVMLADQDPSIAAVLETVDFNSMVEVGLSVLPKKIELHLAAPLSSRQASINRLLTQRSRAPSMLERIPASAQYATILSAGTLQEVYQAALVFSSGLDETLRAADSSSRMLLGLTLDDLLFSWTGNEFAVFGLEGRQHPVYAIQITDERRREEVFNRAFRSIVLSENVRLNLDGMRIPRIEVPEFLQALLRQWDIFMPSPYYIIHRDFLLASESAEALLAAVRAMQRNEVLPRSPAWREIAGVHGNRASSHVTGSAFNLYYSLDLSMPFFLRRNTTLTSFLSLYRQGLARMSFDRGIVEISLSLVPGSGSGVTLVNGYPLDVGVRPSNRIYGAALGTEYHGTEDARLFFTAGNSAFSLNIADNTIHELSGQLGTHWVIPANGVGGGGSSGRNNTRAASSAASGTASGANAWVVTDRGRVTLVDANMEPARGFPVLTGHRLSSPPVAHDGKVYLCDEDGRIYSVDENGNLSAWGIPFTAAVRSPPTFFTVTTRRTATTYVGVYPKSFFGEIWLLDADGKPFPNWPAPIAVNDPNADDEDFIFGIGFGSPLLFAHNNRVLVAFVNQVGQLLIYDETAALVAPSPLTLNDVFYLQPVFDGEYLWLASADGTFYRISMDGEVLSQQIHGFTIMEEGHITLFDVDGDKVPEIFITGEGNAIYAFTRNFRSLEGFPLPAWGQPLFVPAHGNRKAEIFAVGMDGKLYRWQFR